jgi:hypothetical protein
MPATLAHDSDIRSLKYRSTEMPVQYLSGEIREHRKLDEHGKHIGLTKSIKERGSR